MSAFSKIAIYVTSAVAALSTCGGLIKCSAKYDNEIATMSKKLTDKGLGEVVESCGNHTYATPLWDCLSKKTGELDTGKKPLDILEETRAEWAFVDEKWTIPDTVPAPASPNVSTPSTPNRQNGYLPGSIRELKDPTRSFNMPGRRIGY